MNALPHDFDPDIGCVSQQFERLPMTITASRHCRFRAIPEVRDDSGKVDWNIQYDDGLKHLIIAVADGQIAAIRLAQELNRHVAWIELSEESTS